MRASQVRPPGFVYRNSELFCEKVQCAELAAKFGTPLYLYSQESIQSRFRLFDRSFRDVPHTICYSVKANSNLSVLRLLEKRGAGFDVVSGGELARVLHAARKAARKTVFSGVGKTEAEIDAALRAGILMFNVESESELRLLVTRAAKLKKCARIALRVNPDIPAETHPYISTGLRSHKFGVPFGKAIELYRIAAGDKYLDPCGVSVHIGSQIMDVQPFSAAMTRVAELVRKLGAEGIKIQFVDAGGGLGIPYEAPEKEFAGRVRAYADAILKPLRGLNVHVLLEPGRAIIGPAGILLTRVLYLKHNGGKRFAICDAAMNDLLRPALYGAFHEIVPVSDRAEVEREEIDVVGPVCETGDFLARDRNLPELREGDLLAILDAGAYGMSLASNYNSRLRPAEVLVDGKKTRLIRKRETVEEMLAAES